MVTWCARDASSSCCGQAGASSSGAHAGARRGRRLEAGVGRCSVKVFLPLLPQSWTGPFITEQISKKRPCCSSRSPVATGKAEESPRWQAAPPPRGPSRAGGPVRSPAACSSLAPHRTCLNDWLYHIHWVYINEDFFSCVPAICLF